MLGDKGKASDYLPHILFLHVVMCLENLVFGKKIERGVYLIFFF